MVFMQNLPFGWPHMLRRAGFPVLRANYSVVQKSQMQKPDA
jgi:hypothetical protein